MDEGLTMTTITLTRGQRLKLTDLVPAHPSFQLGMACQGPGLVIDFSGFGLDAQGTLADDRYMTFFNQPETPCGAVRLATPVGDQAGFTLALDKLPSTIARWTLTAALDGPGTLAQLTSGYLRWLVAGKEVARWTFTGADFTAERALMLMDVYRKDGGWRVAMIGQGFNGGLDALVRHFGGTITAATPAAQAKPNPTPSPHAELVPASSSTKKLNLEKKLANHAPQLISLAKKLSITLEKKQLHNIVAKVALVMDASGSMSSTYQNGTVQAVLDRVVLIAAQLDDDEKLETWFYASKHAQFPDISIENVTNYLKNHVKSGFLSLVKGLGAGNNEPPVMQEVINTYKSSKLPTLIIFITDGGIYETKEIKKLLVEASYYPIFWQFVGLGGSNYGVLEDLDTMTGRLVDNAGFFHVDDLKRIDDEEIYHRLLSEFPQWLKKARQQGLL